VIRYEITNNRAITEVALAKSFYAPTRTNPLTICVNQKSQHETRVVSGMTATVRAVAIQKRGEIEIPYRVDHEPDEIVLGNPSLILGGIGYG